MKEGFRQSMAWLHTWTGLTVGWVLFFVFVTGTAGYFHYEITRWMQPERPLQPTNQQYDNGALALMAMDRLEQVAPTAEYWGINFPHQSQTTRQFENFSIQWETMPEDGHEGGIRGNELLDPMTGGRRVDVEPRETAGGQQLYRMHYSLHYIDYQIAFRIVGVCTMLMFMAIITGVITHKKIFKDFFTFRPSKGQRSWLDAHNIISVMALPFFLMITYSGLVYFYTSYMPAGIAAIYGSDNQSRDQFFDELYGTHTHEAITRPTASVPDMLAKAETAWGAGQVRSIFIQQDGGKQPRVDINRVRGGQVRMFDGEMLRFHAHTAEPLPLDEPDNGTVIASSMLLSLHEGRFAGPWLRWLYFAVGILGAAMIGTGLVLWTVKRRKQSDSLVGAPFGNRLVEALNLATIAGLPAGVAALFLANRFLPVDMADRANWEINFLFLVWGEAFIYALFRDFRKAWVETLGLAGVLFFIIPFVNALTTDKHLGTTLPAGDWVLAGFDLTMFGLGLSFIYMAMKVKKIWLKKAAKESAGNNTSQLIGEAA